MESVAVELRRSIPLAEPGIKCLGCSLFNLIVDCMSISNSFF